MPLVPASTSEVTMTELVLPSHTNALSSIFGGVIMSWIDIAAAISAQRYCKSNVVTASIDALSFEAPVYAGWVVNLRAKVNYAGRTSMEVGVRVDAENPNTGERFKTASAYLTFVAINADGKPVIVPSIELQTEDEKRRYKQAIIRRESRLQHKAQLQK